MENNSLLFKGNDVSDFNKELVMAYMERDKMKLEELFSRESKADYDIFICIGRSNQVYVMCAANMGIIDDPLMYTHFEHSEYPEEIPSLLLVSQFEVQGICTDVEVNRLTKYKICWRIKPFDNVKNEIKKSFFIGHFKDISHMRFQCIALAAAPNKVTFLTDDSIKFVETFCMETLFYASNGEMVKSEVNLNLSSLMMSDVVLKLRSQKNDNYLQRIVISRLSNTCVYWLRN
ncbi:unnamed protein product [Mytilus coruscus]|uniref:Uncharacterized protein n=1 Tax=Mytilus coruscus TaxID=42192 RepID=A0A6J8C7M7_MYTCO|nr:unnamed protein product [Mytilus coruscus]